MKKKRCLNMYALIIWTLLLSMMYPFVTVATATDPHENSTSKQSVTAIDQTEFIANQSSNEAQPTSTVNKQIDLDALKKIKLIPGGQSLGVELQTLGVLVVGHYLVTEDNEEVSPGEDAGIKVGDVILKIDGKDIKQMKDVKPIVERAAKKNKSLPLEIKRGKKTIKTTLTPATDEKSKEAQIGLYIRDSAAGIGTMTFHEPKTKKYGALGHVISDMDTKKPIQINNGKIVKSSITAIDKGDNGHPGEKQANFSIKDKQLGNITKNTPFGIFGQLNEPLQNGKYDEPMSIALANEVEEGPAKILTVIDGDKVEEFDVEIVSSVPQKKPKTKGMVVKITDPKLLKTTGGIVQGMSGSPIIQHDKIIGAVTHVFVNDPTSGYGAHIEWMMEEADIQSDAQPQEEAS